MAAILVRSSDGRVLAWGVSIADDGTKYTVSPSGTSIWRSSIDPAIVVSAVSLPADVDSFVYTYAAGTFTQGAAYQPAPPVPVMVPAVLTWDALWTYLVGLLGGGATGRAALGGIIKACNAGTNADVGFAVYFQGQTSFTKTAFIAILGDVATTIVSGVQKTAVANNWPTVPAP